MKGDVSRRGVVRDTRVHPGVARSENNSEKVGDDHIHHPGPGGHDQELRRGDLPLVDDDGDPGPRASEGDEAVVVTPGGGGGGRRGPGDGARHVDHTPSLHKHVRPTQH